MQFQLMRIVALSEGWPVPSHVNSNPVQAQSRNGFELIWTFRKFLRGSRVEGSEGPCAGALKAHSWIRIKLHWENPFKNSITIPISFTVPTIREYFPAFFLKLNPAKNAGHLPRLGSSELHRKYIKCIVNKSNDFRHWCAWIERALPELKWQIILKWQIYKTNRKAQFKETLKHFRA